MSTKNKKSVASQALLEMDAITSAIKEESKKSLNVLLEEAVRNALREGCCDEEDEEKDDDYEVINGEQNDAEDTNEDDSNESSSSDVDEDENPEVENGVDGQMPQANMPSEPMPQDMGGQEAPMGGEEQPVDGGDQESGMDDISQYHVGNGAYDLTGENDPKKVAKAYKLMQGDDDIVIVNDGNTIQLKDNEAGTEYVIDLGDGEEDASAVAMDSEEEPQENLNEVFGGIAGFPEDEEDTFGDDHSDFEDDLDHFGMRLGDEDEGIYDSDEEGYDHSFEDDFDNVDDDIYGDEEDFDSDHLDDEEMNNFAFESKKTRKPMKESKEVLFEVDLGYTDNYQDKDPIAGLSVNEPSKDKKSWHKGVPTGTKKPWTGQTKSKGGPFNKTVSEEEMPTGTPEMGGEEPVEEQMNVGGFVQQNSVTTSRVPNSNGRKARSMRGSKVTSSSEPRYSSATNESKQIAAIKKENKELKEAVIALRKNLNEAYMTNVNLGKITKLFLENTTSQSEKIDIVNRFSNEAKTVEQSKALYESINRELKKTNKSVNLTESSVTANGTKMLNETKVYKSDDLLKTIDFMNRVMNC